MLSWWSIQECKFRFAATEIVDRIHCICFYGIRQMGMKDRSLMDKINPTFIALTATAINHCVSAWKAGEFRVLLEFGSGGGAQRKCDTRIINHMVDNACTDIFRHPDNSCNHLSSFVAATEVSKQFSAVLPIGGSAIAISSQPIPCSDINCNRNDITSMTNMTSIENTGLVHGSMIVEGAMSHGGSEWCQWSHLVILLYALLF